jgi:hypothetical protein
MTLTPTEIFFYGSALTAIGWLWGHRLAASRDLIARKSILDREADIRRRQFGRRSRCVLEHAARQQTSWQASKRPARE